MYHRSLEVRWTLGSSLARQQRQSWLLGLINTLMPDYEDAITFGEERTEDHFQAKHQSQFHRHLRHSQLSIWRPWGLLSFILIPLANKFVHCGLDTQRVLDKVCDIAMLARISDVGDRIEISVSPTHLVSKIYQQLCYGQHFTCLVGINWTRKSEKVIIFSFLIESEWLIMLS